MESGLLNRRITIQQRTGARDEYGGISEEWEDVATCWARVVPLRGQELYRAQQVRAENSHNFYVRYRADITAAMRIMYRGEPYNILSITDVEDRRRELQILTQQGVNVG